MHPVELDHYIIPTEPLEEFVNVCVGWINSNISGALVPGLQRAGKTYAIRYFFSNYHAWLGTSVRVLIAEVLYHKSANSEGQFWSDLLKSMGRPTNKRSPDDRRELFVGRLAEAGALSEKKKLVIFLDEAQYLMDMHFKLLIGIHNELWSLYRIRCAWILVGQPELETFQTTYIAEGKRQIVGRFMADIYRFKPLIGLHDFTDAIECFDSKLRHPSEGPTYTDYFAPIAWQSGYRLAADASTIFGCVAQARARSGLPDGQGMTMQGFTTLMNYVLTTLLPTLEVGDRLTVRDIDEAIVATNCMVFEQQEALLATS
ncbi:ATP-binding protein [Xanthomonas euvesicatoria]|uniref:ATP-binding protein n=1 Tax=Xanthomonas euvesicatoria TaxID=456327 RepID=UPI0030C7B4EE